MIPTDERNPMAESPWPTIHAERKALADDLADLTPEQWSTPSLCEGWTVHQVLGHQIATAKMTPQLFLGKMIKNGFKFTQLGLRDADAASSGAPAATLAAWRAVETSTKSPPGPKDSWLGEVLVHSEDIRRPLGISRSYPFPWVTRALDFYAGSNLIVGTKRRIEGVTLKASDGEWQHGEGPLVEGPAMSLLLAATGRKGALDDLTGPGVETLRSR